LNLILNTNSLWDYGISRSGGSVSKRIKWKNLEKQEFTIPKTKYQEKLISLFTQFDKLIYELREQKDTLKKLKHKLLDEILG